MNFPNLWTGITTELLGHGINIILGTPRTDPNMDVFRNIQCYHVTARSPSWVNSVDMKRCTYASLSKHSHITVLYGVGN